jgi:hypothetical protein
MFYKNNLNKQDYFKVSGQHYIQNIPKSDVRIVLTIVALLISWLLHTIQYQKYQRAKKFLLNGTINNLNLKNGGTKQTLELYKRSTDLYENHIKECFLFIFIYIFFIIITAINYYCYK